ncbi:MAG: hypothetical protein K2X90_03845 [Candidatus Babeliaceae bacterium]|nr:hypothetical protein [Candidatus Babeliaceae bacterium]
MNFKKLGSVSLLALAVTSNISSWYQTVSSKTYYSNIPLWEVGKPAKEIFFNTERMQEREDGWCGGLEVAGYGGQSTNSSKLNSYFMPYGKCSLNVIEGIPLGSAPWVNPADGTTNRDIEARNFNIETVNGFNGLDGEQYMGTITFNPKQTIAGVGFCWRQSLWKNHEGIPTIWGELSFPVQYVKNEMNLCENVTQSGGGASDTIGLDNAPHVGTMQAAFAQENWLYGKVDNSKDLSKWGVADVELRVGYNSYHSDCCDLNAYAGVIIPSGTKIDQCNAAYLFNTVIGNNHHVGILYGTHFGFELYGKGNHMLRMELDMSSKYLFSNHQWRSFDLVDKEWSRYLEVYTNVDEATAASLDASPLSINAGTSGINVFTRRLRVSPRFMTNINMGLNYSYCDWDFEIGYNLYTRQAEKVEFPRDCCVDFPLTVAVKDINGTGGTNIARTIKNDFGGSATVLAQYAQNVIQLPELNLDSAAHPALLTNTIYGGVDYNVECMSFPMFFGVAGMYEFSSMNSSFDRWNVLGKFGITY